MALTIKDQLEKLKVMESSEAVVEAKETLKRQVKKDALGRSYGTGRRKCSVARVWIKAGNGKIVVNHKNIGDFFKRDVLRMIIAQPFESVNMIDRFDVYCTVKGGGLSGQAGAIRLGISRALDNFDPDSFHQMLRSGGLLTRDSRVVERKKYGRPKARKRFQFSKR